MDNQKQELQVTGSKIVDAVGNNIKQLQDGKKLVLPKNYSVENALKSAYLILDRSNMLNKDSNSLAKSLLDMCVQGLNPSKNQCYFIDYGGKITLMRSYFGDKMVAINSGLIKDVDAYPIYEGDEVTISFDENGYKQVEVKTDWKNMNNPIVGGYGFVIYKDGTRKCEIMTIERIHKSWSMSKNYGDKNKLQNNFIDDAVRRTLIRKMVKDVFNASCDDSLVVDTYCESTENEYDYKKDVKHDNVIDVRKDQEEVTASQKPSVELPPQPQPAPKQEPLADETTNLRSRYEI